MRLALISFTGRGSRLCIRLTKELSEQGDFCQAYIPEKWDGLAEGLEYVRIRHESLREWTERQFAQVQGIIFIGAAGIAVRAIAEHVKDKLTDPAVVVMDEAGRYAVPILSGHVGGANELAERLGALTGAIPVITTATDCSNVFAVDVYAGKNGLYLSDREAAKKISADLLEGTAVGVSSDFPLEGSLWPGCVPGDSCKANIWFTISSKKKEGCVLKLIPRITALGLGCRKGIGAAMVEAVVREALMEAGIAVESVEAVASIDIKAEEEGLKTFASNLKVPFHTYGAEQLGCVEGTFSASAFVKSVTGVDNVCERAAVCYVREYGGGRLIMHKYARAGVTAALAVREWKGII